MSGVVSWPGRGARRVRCAPMVPFCVSPSYLPSLTQVVLAVSIFSPANHVVRVAALFSAIEDESPEDVHFVWHLDLLTRFVKLAYSRNTLLQHLPTCALDLSVFIGSLVVWFASLCEDSTSWSWAKVFP